MNPDREEEMLAATVHVPEHVVYRSFESETVLLNLHTGQYHGVNRTGGRILELLDEAGGSVSEAAERLAAEYDEPLDEVARDVAAFCDALATRGLIEVADGDGDG